MPVRDLLSAASTQGAAPADPYFYDVSLLLNGDGTNGAQNNTFLDSSTNNFTITRNGNTTQGSFSPYGNLWSNYFNSANSSYLSASTSALDFSGDFTVEGWINLGVTGVSQGIIVGQNNNAFFLRVKNTNGLQVVRTGVVDGEYCNYSFQIGVWYSFAVVRQSGTINFFINGVQQTTQNAGVIGGYSFPSEGTTFIGRAWSTPEYFTGYISNIRVNKGTALYTANYTPSITPLTAISGTTILSCQSNSFKDNSSNNYTWTVNGSPSVQRFSPFNPTAPYSTSVIGGSGYFDGSGDYLSTSTSSSGWAFGSGDFTVELWVNPFAATNRTILANRAGTTGLTTHWSLEFFNTAQRVEWHTGLAIVASSNTNAPLNAWTHIAVVRNGTTLKIYQNGVEVASATDLNIYTDVNPLQIGYEPVFPSGNSAFLGYMSNIRIVKGTAVYTSAFTPPTSPVTAISGTQFLGNMTNAGIPDLAMQNNLETVGNAQVSTSVKKYGTGSLSFNGSGDYLTMPNNPTFDQTGDFTQEMWVYRAGTGSGGFDTLLLKDVTNWAYIGLYGSPLKAVALQHNVGFLITGSTTINNNTWYHIALTRSGSTLRLFVNGVLDGSATYSTNTSGTANEYVGGFVTGGYSFNGYLDDVRYTNGLARYTTTFTPPTAALPTY